jgi:hypothetical protein
LVVFKLVCLAKTPYAQCLKAFSFACDDRAEVVGAD